MIFNRSKHVAAKLGIAGTLDFILLGVTSTFLNMIVIPALYLKFGRAEVKTLSRDYSASGDLAAASD